MQVKPFLFFFFPPFALVQYNLLEQCLEKNNTIWNPLTKTFLDTGRKSD